MSTSELVYVVTGANCGLGLETCKRLLSESRSGESVTLVMACRDLDRAKEAAQQLADLAKEDQDQIVAMELDLSQLSSVRRFCSDFRARFSRLDCLVCNAGVMIDDLYRKTKDGMEVNVGINHLGHFLMVNLLLDTIKQSVPSRIVIVSSMLLKTGKLHLNTDLTDYTLSSESCRSPSRYCDSKLMNALFAMKLVEILSGTGVSVFCVSPGWCKTSLHRYTDIPWYQYPVVMLVALFFMNSAYKGSETIHFCATNPDLSNENGAFFYRNSIRHTETEEFLRGFQDKLQDLWTVSKRLVGLGN